MKYELLFQEIHPALDSKVTELQLYDYQDITDEKLWEFCLQHIWKNKDVESLSLHKIVSDILKITGAQYMTMSHIETQKEEVDWFSDLNQEELQTLLEPTAKKE